MGSEEKAIPIADEVSHPYWVAARQGRLSLQQCENCLLIAARPRVVCPRCQSTEFAWTDVTGTGTIHSFTIVRQTTAPGFSDETPYVVAYVQVTEDSTCILLANLLVHEDRFDSINVGAPVRVVFENRHDVTVPQFELVM